jgi:hypothetical protein
LRGYVARSDTPVAARILQKHWESGLPSGVFGEFVFTELTEEETASLTRQQKRSAQTVKQNWLQNLTSQSPTASIIALDDSGSYWIPSDARLLTANGIRIPSDARLLTAEYVKFTDRSTCEEKKWYMRVVPKADAPLPGRLRYYYKRFKKEITSKLELQSSAEWSEKWRASNIAKLADEFEQNESELSVKLLANFGVDLNSISWALDRYGKLAWKSVQCFSSGQHVTLPSPSGSLGNAGTVTSLTFGTKYQVKMDLTLADEFFDAATTVALPSQARPAYGPGTKLCICRDGTWQDAEVRTNLGGGTHAVAFGEQADAVSVFLNEANHYLAQQDFHYQAAKKRLLQRLHKASSTVQDAITLNVLKTGDQLVKIGLKSGSVTHGFELNNVLDVAKYAKQAPLFDCKEARYLLHGSWKPRDGQRLPLLVEAKAGTGKTWMTTQLQYHLSADVQSCSIPLLLPLQQIAVHLQNMEGFRRQPSWFDRNITLGLLIEVASYSWPKDQRADFRRCLFEAFSRREVVVILDGIDEASDLAQAVVDFMHKVVVAGGHQLVTTSRPEGLFNVRAESLNGFLTVQLLPFSQEDQKKVLEQQFTTNPRFFKYLFKFKEEKDKMDQIYSENFDEKASLAITSIEGVKLDATHKFGGLPVSQQTLLGFAAQVKPLFDTSLEAIVAQVDGLSVKHLKVAALKGTSDGSVGKNGELVRLIYRVAQKAHSAKDGVITLNGSSAFDGSDLSAEQISALKMDGIPLTIHSEMSGLVEVRDVVRATILCDTAQQMEEVLRLSSETLGIVQLKNYFKKLGPTHYRRFGLNIRVPIPGTSASHVTELQVQYADIYKNQPDHLVYKYFRDLFSDPGQDMDDELDRWLGFEKQMKLLQSIMRVPVLMSMLVVAMRSDDGKRIPKVPSSTGELYQIVVDEQIQRATIAGEDSQVTERAMKLIGAYAHLKQLPLFGKKHVAEALAYDKACANCWHQLLVGDVTQLPCYKVLDVDSQEAAYQPRHLSSQEFLCVMFFKEMVLDPSVSIPKQFSAFDLCKWQSGKEHQLKALCDSRNANFFLLAGVTDGLPQLAFPGMVCPNRSGLKPNPLFLLSVWCMQPVQLI